MNFVSVHQSTLRAKCYLWHRSPRKATAPPSTTTPLHRRCLTSSLRSSTRSGPSLPWSPCSTSPRPSPRRTSSTTSRLWTTRNSATEDLPSPSHQRVSSRAPSRWRASRPSSTPRSPRSWTRSGSRQRRTRRKKKRGTKGLKRYKGSATCKSHRHSLCKLRYHEMLSHFALLKDWATKNEKRILIVS